MLYARKGLLVSAALFAMTMFGEYSLAAQQHNYEYTNIDGSKGVIDAHGWTETSIKGMKRNIGPQELAGMCDGLDRYPSLAQSNDGKVVTAVCEAFATLNPRTSIEVLSWDRFFTRLFLVSQPYTNFKRYRGVLLATDREGVSSYDTSLLPEKLGPHDSCALYDSGPESKAKWYIFRCKLEEPTYAVAVTVADALKASVKNVGLTEDQLEEHGLLASDRVNRRCAPTGECENSHTYVTTVVDGKALWIEAKPTFTRLPMPLQLSLKGYEGMITGVAPDSASVEVSIWSFQKP